MKKIDFSPAYCPGCGSDDMIVIHEIGHKAYCICKNPECSVKFSIITKIKPGPILKNTFRKAAEMERNKLKEDLNMIRGKEFRRIGDIQNYYVNEYNTSLRYNIFVKFISSLRKKFIYKFNKNSGEILTKKEIDQLLEILAKNREQEENPSNNEITNTITDNNKQR